MDIHKVIGSASRLHSLIVVHTISNVLDVEIAAGHAFAGGENRPKHKNSIHPWTNRSER